MARSGRGTRLRTSGRDGHWVQPARLLSTNIELIPADLERTLPVRSRFDLCISLEVAEHLSADRASSFVQELCAASDLVRFSDAISCQGGTSSGNPLGRTVRTLRLRLL